MRLGPEMAREARLFFRVGPEQVARVLGPRLFGRSLAEAAVRAMPDARLVRVPAGHNPSLEQPDRALLELKAFIRQ